MAQQFTTAYTPDARELFPYYKRLSDRAIEQ